MTIKIFDSAPEECPRFEFCNLNNCPLHSDYNGVLFNDSSDPAVLQKQKCIAKTIRKRIGLKWNLKNGGMTIREKKSQENWDNLPESVKQERIAKIKQLSPVSRLLATGNVIIPPHNKRLQNPHTNEEKSSINGYGGGE